MSNRTISVKQSTTPPPEEWKVPAHLQGLKCILCGAAFKDGDVHGEVRDPIHAPDEFYCSVKQRAELPVIDIQAEPHDVD